MHVRLCVYMCVHKLVELHRLEPKINDKLNSFPTAHLQNVHVARSILFVVALACTFRWLNSMSRPMYICHCIAVQ